MQMERSHKPEPFKEVLSLHFATYVCVIFDLIFPTKFPNLSFSQVIILIVQEVVHDMPCFRKANLPDSGKRKSFTIFVI